MRLRRIHRSRRPGGWLLPGAAVGLLCLAAGASCALAQQGSAGAVAPVASSASTTAQAAGSQSAAQAAALAAAEAQEAVLISAQTKGKKAKPVKQGKPGKPDKPVKQSKPGKQGKQSKNAYTGPTAIVSLPPTPMLDDEGRQRVDPDGKLMFNAPVQQLRDKKGHPVFDASGKPVFQTASNLGYDAKGKKIVLKKVKPPKMRPVSIVSGILTVDGWTGKARMNYDIADLKFLYIYVPGIGTTIVSQEPFPGAKEQPGAFNGSSLRVTVEGHPIELASEKPLLGEKPEAAWVMVDRDFMLPATFPVLGYGTATKAPYAWPGSKQDAETAAPPLPSDVMPTLLLSPCPAGMMRRAGPPVLPGQKTSAPPCTPIQPKTAPVSPASTAVASKPSTPTQ